ALVPTPALSPESIGYRVREGLELLAGVAVHPQIAAERIAHLVTAPARVLAQHEDSPLTAQFVHARAVMSRHGQDQIGALDQLACQQACPMSREIEAPLEAYEVGAFRRGCPVPRARAGRRDFHFEAARLERALEQRLGERAAADVAGADEQDTLDHGARRPTARRSSCTLNVPSRTICARGLVQSTTVEGGRFPRTPPSSTSSAPDSTAGAKSRAIASAPGPGGWPGRLADVEVSGAPSAPTRLAIA